MKKNIDIGIDIGSYSVKFAVLEKIKTERCLKYRQEFFLTEKLTPEKLKALISEFIEKHKIHRPQLYFTLPHTPPGTTVRFFNMPALHPKILNKSMKYEIEEKTVIDTSATYYQWDTLKSDTENLSVVAVVIDKSLIQIIKRATKKQWTVRIIEPQFVSFVRLIEGDAAVVDFGHSGIRLMLYRGGLPVQVHLIESGIDNETAIAREIGRYLRLTEADGCAAVEKIYYTGNAVKTKYSTDVLASLLEIDLAPLVMAWGASDRSEDYVYAAAVGACLAGNESRPKINFSLCEEKQKVSLKSTALFLIGFLVVLQAGLFMQNRTAQQLYDAAASQNNLLSSHLASVQSAIRQENTNTALFESAEHVLQVFRESTSPLSRIMHDIAMRIPEDVSLSSVSVHPSIVAINGTADDYSGISFFVIALEELGTVNITNIGEDKSFHLELRLEGVI